MPAAARRPVAHVGGWPAFRCACWSASGLSPGRSGDDDALRRADAAAPPDRPRPAGARGDRAGGVRGGRPHRRRRTPRARWRPGDDAAARPAGRDRRQRRALPASRDFTLRYVDEDERPGRRRRWVAAVDATWRFARLRRRARATPRSRVTLRSTTATGSRSTGFGGGDRRTPLWLAGPLRGAPYRRHAGAGRRHRGRGRRATPRRAEAAVPVVRRVLPQWRRGLVVEVPGVGRRPRRRPLGADAGRATTSIAAVTTVRRRLAGAGRAGARVRQPRRLRRPAADRARRS